MKLYYVEVKLFRIVVVLIKVVVLFTVLGLLASIVVNAVLDTDEGSATFDVKQTSRIGSCLDQPDNTQFDITQQYFDRVIPKCPCCIDTSKPCDDEECNKCKHFYQVLKKEECDNISKEDFKYMEQQGAQ